MPLILPYEIFLKIIEELAYEAKLALKPTEVDVEFEFWIRPNIKAHHSLMVSKYFTSDHIERYDLIHNISQVDKRSRTIVLAIMSLRPFDMRFCRSEHNPYSTIRTGWICPALDTFTVFTMFQSELYDALNLGTFGAADAAIVDCIRFVKVWASTDYTFPAEAKYVALLPNLEGIIFDLDDVTTMVASHSYREIRLLSVREVLSGVIFQRLADWAEGWVPFSDIKPVYKSLMQRNIKTFVQEGSEIIRIDPALLYEDRFRTGSS